MKKMLLYSISLVFLLSMVGCSNDGHISEQSTIAINHNAEPDNSTVDIDTSSIVKIEKSGHIPVSTDSIKAVLEETGRFEITEIPHLSGTDVFCGLDKADGNSIADISFTISDDNATSIVSYNFSKNTINQETESSVRWGLDILLHIFGDSLTDDTWNDIVSIVYKNEDVGALGTDYDGYSNINAGIKLIYADLGSNVQIDIVPMNDIPLN